VPLRHGGHGAHHQRACVAALEGGAARASLLAQRTEWAWWRRAATGAKARGRSRQGRASEAPGGVRRALLQDERDGLDRFAKAHLVCEHAPRHVGAFLPARPVSTSRLSRPRQETFRQAGMADGLTLRASRLCSGGGRSCWHIHARPSPWNGSKEPICSRAGALSRHSRAARRVPLVRGKGRGVSV